jgi:hypothetical protein
MNLKNVLVIGLFAMVVTLLPADSMAGFTTLYVDITSPQEGEKYATHDRMWVRWIARCYGVIPTHDIHYMIRLDGATLTYDYYDDIRPDDLGQAVGYFTMYGTYVYQVPGNGYSKNPNALLEVWSGDDDCADCYDWIASVVIGIKTWYDPLPIPTEQASVATDAGEVESTTTWGRVKALYSAP